MIAMFSRRDPFDAMHQKRLFVIHSENITTQERHLHIAAADGAPGFIPLVQKLAQVYSASRSVPTPQVMDDYNADWDSLYPFSAFLSPYKIPLPTAEYAAFEESGDGQRFEVRAVNDIIDEEAGTRNLTLQVIHPGVIWTVIAFNAHVLSWTLDGNPPNEHARHHIKEGSFYASTLWSVDLVVKHSPGSPGLRVNYVGIREMGMWPAKKSEMHLSGEHQLAMALFEELDDWLDKETHGTVDALLLACVGGVSVV